MSWVPSAHQKARARIVRRRKLKRILLATVVTIVVFVAVGAAIRESPGWPAFKGYFLYWPDAKAVFHSMLVGFWINVRMFLIAEVAILALAMLVAVVRQSTSPWLAPARIVAVGYTDLFRGVPTLLVVIIFAEGIPALRLTGFTNDPFWLCTIALVLCYGAYVAEVLRAGILSVHPTQIASADALALTRPQTIRYVVLPQAVRRVIPPLINDFLSLQKDTALVSTVGVFEVLRASTDFQSYHFNGTSLIVAGAFFLVITIPVARFGDWVMIRQIRKEQGR